MVIMTSLALTVVPAVTAISVTVPDIGDVISVPMDFACNFATSSCRSVIVL